MPASMICSCTLPERAEVSALRLFDTSFLECTPRSETVFCLSDMVDSREITQISQEGPCHKPPTGRCPREGLRCTLTQSLVFLQHFTAQLGMKWEFETDPAKTRSRSKRRVEVVGPEDIALFACQRLQDNSRAMTILSLHDAYSNTDLKSDGWAPTRARSRAATRIAVRVACPRASTLRQLLG